MNRHLHLDTYLTGVLHLFSLHDLGHFANHLGMMSRYLNHPKTDIENIRDFSRRTGDEAKKFQGFLDACYVLKRARTETVAAEEMVNLLNLLFTYSHVARFQCGDSGPVSACTLTAILAATLSLASDHVFGAEVTLSGLPSSEARCHFSFPQKPEINLARTVCGSQIWQQAQAFGLPCCVEMGSDILLAWPFDASDLSASLAPFR